MNLNEKYNIILIKTRILIAGNKFPKKIKVIHKA